MGDRAAHTYANGIREDMSIDQTMHSLFGASKVAADVLVQEYGRYFSLNTACFRGGCLTGPSHSGTQLHGFLAYLMKCTVTGVPYTVFGYKGKQVRDNIHSFDLIRAFDEYSKAPIGGAVYNIGGGRLSNCSMLEGIRMCEQIANRELDWTYSDRIQPAIICGGSAIWLDFSATIPAGNSPMMSRLSCRKSTSSTSRGGTAGAYIVIDRGKRNVLGIAIDAVDYEAAVARIIAAAHERRSLGVTALAVHG